MCELKMRVRSTTLVGVCDAAVTCNSGPITDLTFFQTLSALNKVLSQLPESGWDFHLLVASDTKYAFPCCVPFDPQ